MVVPLPVCVLTKLLDQVGAKYDCINYNKKTIVHSLFIIMIYVGEVKGNHVAIGGYIFKAKAP